MSIHHIEQAAELNMRPAMKLALMAVCDDASKDTRVAYPGLEKVMLWSGLGQRAALNVLKQLRDENYILRLGGGYPGRRVEYLVFPTVEEIESITEYLQAVDNSEIKGAPPSTHSVLKGAEKLRMGAPPCTPTVLTPVKDLKNSSSVDNHTAVDNPPGDDKFSSHPPLGIRERFRRRRLRNQLDIDRLQELTDGMYDEFPEQDRARLLLMQAYEVLGVPAMKGVAVSDPTAYVSAALNRDRPSWVKRAHRLWVDS
ncbi:MAG: hypothetical protein KF861_00375 [Planctomycetaceae bacterium]|nr:hypothetical protein [Planctomycetaceae bacterium]